MRLESCAALCLASKHGEMLAAAESAIAAAARSAEPTAPYARAGLASLIALSHRALDDEAMVSASLATAGESCPNPVVEGCPPRLAALSVPIARRLLELAGQSAETASQRILAARVAAFWLRWRLVAAPGDQGAQGLLEVASEDMSEAHADSVAVLIRRQDWQEARRLIEEGRQRDELPVARAEVLVEVLAASLRNVVERLTAPAVRGAKSEDRALAGLERAESLLASMSDTMLPARQWSAMRARVWRGFAKLGLTRLGSGNFDGAIDALMHALAMPEIGPRRQPQVRDALIHALRLMGEEKTAAVERLLGAGDREAAATEVEGLVTRIERGRAAGLSAEDLTEPSAMARRLADLFEAQPPQGAPEGAADPEGSSAGV